MKRVIKKNISSCNECHFCEIVYGIDYRYFRCTSQHKTSSDMLDNKNHFKVALEISDWFENCKVLEVVE